MFTQRKIRYKAKITFTMDEKHPDIKYVKDWTKDKEFTFDDVYEFSEDYSREEIERYIKHDLKLVAGGGYNTEHIHNVKFEIKRA